MSFVLLGILNSQAAGGGVAGGIDLIQTATTTGDTVQFFGLNALTDYKHLFFEINAQGAGSISTENNISLNNNTSLRYNKRVAITSGTSIFYSHIEGETDVEIMRNAPLNSPFMLGEMTMANFSNSSIKTNAFFRSGFVQFGSEQTRTELGAWSVQSTQLPDSIKFTFNSVNMSYYRISMYGGFG